MSRQPGAARTLAEWVVAVEPSADDLALAQRALTDTIAVALAAREHPILRTAASLPEAGRWAVACHILDFDDLHMPTTTHISTVCVPVALSSGGDHRAYLAGAGVMARLGAALGWRHYSSGWHASTTAGALAAAATASYARGLDAEAVARAMALAVPAAGGVQRSFGTDAKSLQIGFAAEAGIRAATLAAAGATAEPAAVDDWLSLVGGDAGAVAVEGPVVPDGLAIKMYPCCYALQRPISAVAEIAGGVTPESVRRIVVRTPAGTVTPLIHHRPKTGLEGKFSLEYAAGSGAARRAPGHRLLLGHRRPAPRGARTRRAGRGRADGRRGLAACRRGAGRGAHRHRGAEELPRLPARVASAPTCCANTWPRIVTRSNDVETQNGGTSHGGFVRRGTGDRPDRARLRRRFREAGCP